MGGGELNRGFPQGSGLYHKVVGCGQNRTARSIRTGSRKSDAEVAEKWDEMSRCWKVASPVL